MMSVANSIHEEYDDIAGMKLEAHLGEWHADRYLRTQQRHASAVSLPWAASPLSCCQLLLL
jgi:hypothetical protein